jgi:hypothetical protein
MTETFSQPVVISAMCGLVFSVMVLVILIPYAIWRAAFYLLVGFTAGYVAIWSAIIIWSAFS